MPYLKCIRPQITQLKLSINQVVSDSDCQSQEETDKKVN